MNPQDELYTKFFTGGQVKVRDMTDEQLIAFILDRESIAFQARAELDAGNGERELRRRKRKGISNESNGLLVSVEGEVVSDAIKAINERNKKLGKMEKIKASLIAMGVSDDEAERMIQARNVKTNKETEKLAKNSAIPDFSKMVNDLVVEPSKPFTNPFSKKG